jgi:transaldolase
VAIKGKIAIANAKLAYREYQSLIASDRWQRLAAHGATVQRLLWASTGTKNPDYSDVMYVDELIGPDTVNTLPPNTLTACADRCDPQNRLESGVPEAQTLIDSLADPDIDIQIDQVMAELLDDGIDKFVEPFQSLIQSLQAKIDDLAPVA